VFPFLILGMELAWPALPVYLFDHRVYLVVAHVFPRTDRAEKPIGSHGVLVLFLRAILAAWYHALEGRVCHNPPPYQ